MDSPLHIISAQICEIGVTLASEAVEGKSNEIPAVQELLKKMDIEGCLIVADALNCQQKTAEAIICVHHRNCAAKPAKLSMDSAEIEQRFRVN